MKAIIQREKRIVGLDIEENCVVASTLTKRGKMISLDRYSVVSNLKDLIKDSFFKGENIAINLPAQAVLFRSFHLAPSFLKSKNKKQDILGFLIRQSLPFKLEDCYWDTFILNSNLNLIAARKEVVEKYIAQVQGSDLKVSGVTASSIALYNVLIYTYPEREKDRSMLLNIKTNSSELLIYEAKRLWVYPLSMGKKNFQEESDAEQKFSVEIQRLFNSHYSDNPLPQKIPSHFYVSGQEGLEGFVSFLRKIMTDSEIEILQPLKKLKLINTTLSKDRQIINLSLGLGLTYLEIPFGLKINLIEGKIRKERFLATINLLKQIAFFAAVFITVCLLFLDLKLIQNLKKEASIYKNNQLQISSILPKTKALKEEKEKLQGLDEFLERKLDQQGFYVKSLAAISGSKPQAITIKEFDAQMKEGNLEVVISGNARKYEDINVFLGELKKNEDIKEVKVVASTFPALETEAKDIDFKLRFEVPCKSNSKTIGVSDKK